MLSFRKDWKIWTSKETEAQKKINEGIPLAWSPCFLRNTKWTNTLPTQLKQLREKIIF
jgi:hypothetical protein